MLSGHVFQVMDGDSIDSMLWLPTEDVLVCSRIFSYQGSAYTLYEVINTDEDGEKVDATLLR